MAETKLIIQHEVGLHARPASAFVQTAVKFSSTISVLCNGRIANAKSIIAILSLGAKQGAEIKITADGADADQAVAALEELVQTNFGE